MDSSKSPDQIDSSPPPDRLSRLPAELLDRIFFEVYAKPSDQLVSPGPAPFPPPPLPPGIISKALRPFQRRHYTRLDLRFDLAHPSAVYYVASLLRECDNLERLVCPAVASLPVFLALLPNPKRLASLALSSLDDSGVEDGDEEAETAVVTLHLPAILPLYPSLVDLKLDCPVDLGDGLVRRALTLSSLEGLSFGKATRETLRAEDLLELIEEDRLPKLHSLQLDTVVGRRGADPLYYDFDPDPRHCDPFVREDEGEQDWVVPRWPKHFQEGDVYTLLEAADRHGVAISGTTIEALGVLDAHKAAFCTHEEEEWSDGGEFEDDDEVAGGGFWPRSLEDYTLARAAHPILLGEQRPPFLPSRRTHRPHFPLRTRKLGNYGVLSWVLPLPPWISPGDKISPLSKFLLPFQRRHTIGLHILPGPDSLVTSLSQWSHLEVLVCPPIPDLPAILASLPNPHLTPRTGLGHRWNKAAEAYRTAGVATTLLPSLAVLTSLKKLSLDCPRPGHLSVELSAASPSSTHFVLGDGAKSSVKGCDVCKLVSGEEEDNDEPSLKHLTVDIVWGERGNDFGYAEVTGKYWAVEGSWTLPTWPEQFSDVERHDIVEAGQMARVKVDGTAVEALKLAEEFEEELAKAPDMEAEYALRKGNGRRSRYYVWGSEEDESEDE